MFDPERKPRQPESVRKLLKERQDYFDPKIAEDEDGFTLKEAQALGWNVDRFYAQKHFPGRGLVRVVSSASNEGGYGVLTAIHEYELREHQRAQAHAREIYRRLVREERQQLQALNAAKAAYEKAPSEFSMAHVPEQRARRKAIGHARKALELTKELDAVGPFELPQEYLDELKEPAARCAARKERT